MEAETPGSLFSAKAGTALSVAAEHPRIIAETIGYRKDQGR
jgi:hypothetical protein